MTRFKHPEAGCFANTKIWWNSCEATGKNTADLFIADVFLTCEYPLVICYTSLTGTWPWIFQDFSQQFPANGEGCVDFPHFLYLVHSALRCQETWPAGKSPSKMDAMGTLYKHCQFFSNVLLVIPLHLSKVWFLNDLMKKDTPFIARTIPLITGRHFPHETMTLW